MSEETRVKAEERDSRPARSSTTTRTLTPKGRVAGRERLLNPTDSERAIMLRSGYSEATAKNPAQNLPAGGPPAPARRYIREEGEHDPSIRALDRKARRYVSKTLDAADVSDGVKAPLALGTIKLAQDVEQPESAFSEVDHH